MQWRRCPDRGFRLGTLVVVGVPATGVYDGDAADLSFKAMAKAVDSYRQVTGASLVRCSGITVRMLVTREVLMLLIDQHRDVLDATELTEAEIEGGA